MKYYKLMQDNAVIGAISSNNFVRYSPITRSFKRADETQGEYISYQGQVYRAPWMRPIIEQIDYISVLVLEISEEEYNIYREAIEHNEESSEPYEEEIPVIPNPIIDPIEEGSINFIRTSKLNEMSYTCRQTIEAGFDLPMTDGEIHHFSLSQQDQLNLMALSILAETEDTIPYHADSEESRFYPAAEIKLIINTANTFKNYQLAYYNSLKSYINALETIEEIAAITYGTPIPEEYKSDVLKVLE